MPLIPPMLEASLRRQWPMVCTILIFMLFMLTHQAVFQPAAKRYQQALDRAHELGLTIEFGQPLPVLPPRVFARVADNAVSPAAALEQGNSGVFAARLLEEIALVSAKCGLDVVASEPLAVSQQLSSTTVRAHVTLHGSYGGFVGFMDSLARGEHLISVDRFSITSQANELTFEVWLSRLVLKREDGSR